MKLRTHKSYFKNLPEGTPPRRLLPRVTQYLYFLILFAIVAGVLYLMVMRMLYFSGRGQVEREKTILSSTVGGEVVKLIKKRGDTFARGDILAQIKLADKCEGRPDLRVTQLQYDVKRKQAQIAILRSQLQPLQQEGDRRKLYRALELGDGYSRRKLEQLNNKSNTLREQIQLLEADITVRQEELAALEQQMLLFADKVCDVETITAPFDGTVYLVKSDLNEYAAKGAPLLVVVADTAPVYIDTYLRKKYLKYIRLDKRMTIKFPDRYKSIGRIQTMASTAQAVPRRDLKDYVPKSTMIRVQLVPVDQQEQLVWQKYDRIDVRVKGKK